MRFKFFLFSISFAFFLQACTSSKPAGGTVSSQQKQLAPDDPQKLQAEENFIEASKMALLGDFQQALNLYKESIKDDPTNDAAYYAIAKIFYDQKRYIDALDYAAQAAHLDPANKWYEDLYGTLLGGTGNYKEAIKIYQQLVKTDPDNADAWFSYAFYLEQNKQTQEALTVLTQIEERFGMNEDLSQQIVHLWLQEGKVEPAADELRKLIDSNPDDPRYYSMLVDLYMSNKMDDKAYGVLQELLKVDPHNPQTSLALYDYYSAKGDSVGAFNYLLDAFNSPDLSIDQKIPILLKYLPFINNDETKKSEALQLAQAIVKAHPGDAKSFAMYGDILSQLDQFQSAINEYKKSIGIDNGKFTVWQQVMYLYSRLNNYDSLYDVSEHAIDLFPDQYLAFYFNGIACTQLKKYTSAVDAYGKAIQMGSDDKGLIAQMYANMGDAFQYLKNYSASDSCYELALLFDPNNVYVMNNYAYYLSLRNSRLEDAKKMSEKANALAPNQQAYEDTYAWVLYKNGEYSDAKKWIDKALDSGGDQDGTILEHAGDILFKLGDVNGAVEYWMKAKAKNVDSENIDKKIAERKLFE